MNNIEINNIENNNHTLQNIKIEKNEDMLSDCSLENNSDVCDISKKIYYDKLFPKINNVVLQNLQIDFESISYITTPTEAKKISDIISKHIIKFKSPKESVIIDATGGAGGDTIMFCSIFGSVISIELDEQRYSYLKHNVDQYNFKNITAINGDSTVIIPKLQFVDVIYIDPPWGGKDYKSKDKLRFMFGSEEIETFITKCFTSDNMISHPKLIALKMPKNYDLKYLYQILHNNFDIYLYELKKINILIIELMN